MVTKFKILKWIHFSKISTFFWQQKFTFLRKISKNWRHFLNFYFSKNYLKLQIIFNYCRASLKIQRIFRWKKLYNFDFYQKPQRNYLRSWRIFLEWGWKLLQNLQKIECNLWKNSVNQHFVNIFHINGNLRNQHSTFCAYDQKIKKFLKKARKFWPNISEISASSPKLYIP